MQLRILAGWFEGWEDAPARSFLQPQPRQSKQTKPGGVWGGGVGGRVGKPSWVRAGAAALPGISSEGTCWRGKAPLQPRAAIWGFHPPPKKKNTHI